MRGLIFPDQPLWPSPGGFADKSARVCRKLVAVFRGRRPMSLPPGIRQARPGGATCNYIAVQAHSMLETVEITEPT